MSNKSIKVVLCGPQHIGKSCLRFGLKEAIKALKNSPYPYVITACPDGEGSWFQETVSENSNLAIELKKINKGCFSQENVEIWRDSIKNCREPITLIDIGGIVDAKNEDICRYADHAILLYSHSDHLREWRTFCEKLKLRIIAELCSDYDGAADTIPVLGKDNVYRGSIHRLERGDLTIQRRPTAIETAQILVSMVTTKEQNYDYL